MSTLPTTLNLNNLTVDPKTGQVSLSGLSSGIDWQKAVASIIAARQTPIDTLNQTITNNQAKISALQDLRTKVAALQSAITNMTGAVTVDNSTNVFAAKQTFASTSRGDGATASPPANLIGATVTNAAALGNHTVEIRRVATSEKIGGSTFASQTASLGFSGTFHLTGANTATITVNVGDTLQDIRDRVNNANTGTSATGVSASIVQVSSNQFILVLTNTQTGQAITLANETGGVLNSLGLSADGGTTFSNELQKAQTARFTIDGLTNPKRYESEFLNSSAAQLTSLAPAATFPGSFDIKVGADTVTVNYTSADTVNSLTTKINDAITAAGAGNAVFDAGASASVVADGSGSRLVITDASGAAITFGDTNGLLSGLGMNNDLVLERNSNTVNDVFPGVTLTLFQAEEGTKINIEIDQDQTQIENAASGFVTAYNALRAFINTQNQVDPNSGQKSANAGPLFGSTTLGTIKQTLSRIAGAGVAGANPDLSVLAQIGISFVDNATQADPTQDDTLVLDKSKLDTAILNNPADLQKLFSFSFSSSDPRVSLLGFTGQTAFNQAGYTLNLTDNGTDLTGANINGVANSATVSGNNITVTDATGANGLKLLYNGTGNASNIQINYTVGLAAQMNFALSNFLNTTSGTIQADVTGLQTQNTQNQNRVSSMTDLLNSQKDTLTQKFINMETALAQASTLQSTLNQMFLALQPNQQGF
jgi:flagellar hook-associated protein 2